MKRHGHHPRRQSALTEPPQRVEERLQLRLVIFNDVVPSILLSSHQHPAGIPQQLVTVVAEVELAVMPAAVRGDQLR
jgi:hypothetical protein